MAPRTAGGDETHDRETRSGARREPASATPAEPVEEAIQAGCASLLALQASLARVEEVPGDQGKAKAALNAAVALVHEAISELEQSVSRPARSPWSLGFVASARTSPTSS